MGCRSTPISPQAHRLLQLTSSTTFDNNSTHTQNLGRTFGCVSTQSECSSSVCRRWRPFSRIATIRRMLPAKDTASPIRCDDCNSPNGVATYVARSPSALSFSLCRDITPGIDANGTRLPCRAQKVRPGKAVSVTEPSPDSPRVLPHASY